MPELPELIGRNALQGKKLDAGFLQRMGILIKNEAQGPATFLQTGANDGARTRDTKIHNLVLYQLNYVRHRYASAYLPQITSFGKT